MPPGKQRVRRGAQIPLGSGRNDAEPADPRRPARAARRAARRAVRRCWSRRPAPARPPRSRRRCSASPGAPARSCCCRRAGWRRAPPPSGWPSWPASRSGGTIGYATRLDSKRSARTRILVLTEGIFLQPDPGRSRAGRRLGGAVRRGPRAQPRQRFRAGAGARRAGRAAPRPAAGRRCRRRSTARRFAA